MFYFTNVLLQRISQVEKPSFPKCGLAIDLGIRDFVIISQFRTILRMKKLNHKLE